MIYTFTSTEILCIYIYILNLLQTRNKKKKKKGKNTFQPKPGFFGISLKCLSEQECMRERQESGSSQCSDIEFDGMCFDLTIKQPIWSYIYIYIATKQYISPTGFKSHLKY